jgi:hypothetical protein
MSSPRWKLRRKNISDHVKNKIKAHTEAKKAGQLAPAHAHAENPQKPVRIPKSIQSLLDSLTDDDIRAVAQVYREGMTATRRYWVDEGKDEDGRIKGHWEIEPDHKTRIQAANMVAAYREGLPVHRQIQLTGEFEDLQTLMEPMQQSPAGRESLERDSLQKTVEG